jgi:hypothetical protein
MNLITKAQQIKDILEPISAEDFTTGVFRDLRGKSCSLGFIHRHFSSVDDPKGDGMGFGARQLTEKFLKDKHGLECIDISFVNNGPYINGYTEPEIKDRVIHLVNDMIEAGY